MPRGLLALMIHLLVLLVIASIMAVIDGFWKEPNPTNMLIQANIYLTIIALIGIN